MLSAVLASSPASGGAQLLSPGRLARAHEAIEGLRNCTSCHQLGTPGISAERCLECHQPVRERLANDTGYHATVTPDACAECHQDHLGVDFDLVRLDEASFDHVVTGYELEGSHAEVDCRGCHQPTLIRDPGVLAAKSEGDGLERTFLGLATTCNACHATEDPHGDQFATRGCNDCHDIGRWEEPPLFDHSGTSFPLEGLHAEVSCSDCHGSGTEARYRPLHFDTCAGCHSDPHGGAMEGTCSSCHTTTGWHELGSASLDSSFDHSRTSFALGGAHSIADCAACHRTGRAPRSALIAMSYIAGTAARAYPLPVADNCYSCHVDRHAVTGTAPQWRDCASCHGETRWEPSVFGVVRHEESDFPLTGAHAATPCSGCHVPQPPTGVFSLSLDGRACVDCHQADDPHEGRYTDLACESCHTTEVFEEAAFDHVAFTDPDKSCTGCHSADDPHGGQFDAQDCSACHETDGFEIERFDHSTTRYPLDGAHDEAACAACHATEGSGAESFVRYVALGTECTDCHGGFQ